MLKLILCFLLAVCGKAAITVTPEQYDASCGTVAGYNCRTAFQEALAALKAAGGGTLQLSYNRYYLAAPEIPVNAFPNGYPLPLSSLIVVPAHVIINGRTGLYGGPGSTIYWSNPSIPAFVFDKADYAAMYNIQAVFNGVSTTTAGAYPHGDVDLLKALGYTITWPHYNTIGGGNQELSTFVYVVDSNHVTFQNLSCTTANQDLAHITPNFITLKGLGPVASGGGLTAQADGNKLAHITVSYYGNAFSFVGQKNLIFDHISGDYRAGNGPGMPPGHLAYFQGIYNYDSTGALLSTMVNTNVAATNISEGSHLLNDSGAGGTLAIKFTNGSHFTNITSSNPVGVINTLYASQNDTFENVTWSIAVPFCTTDPTNCVQPAIYVAPSASYDPPTSGITWKNITLSSPASPTWAQFIGNGLNIDGLNITTQPNWNPSQAATNGIVDIRNAVGGSITGYVYTPVITAYDPSAHYNSPLTVWNSATSITADVTIDWPSNVNLPPSGALVSPGMQEITQGVPNATISTAVIQSQVIQ